MIYIFVEKYGSLRGVVTHIVHGQVAALIVGHGFAACALRAHAVCTRTRSSDIPRIVFKIGMTSCGVEVKYSSNQMKST